MARHDSDKEDLLRQATALVNRVELTLPGFAEPIVGGFRRDGSASYFFGTEAVYQFNASGELRRAYLGGLLYKADGGKLFQMRRERSETEVALLSRELGDAETVELIRDLRSRLAGLTAALAARDYALVGEVPPEGNVVGRVEEWLAAHASDVRIANRPNVG